MPVTAAPTALDRCAAHPSRPAVDACPVCARPRCGADAAGPACALCAAPPMERTVAAAPRRTASDLERLVRAGLAGMLVCLLSGPVASEYVQSGLFAYVGPFVVGVVCGAAALRAARTDGRGPLGTRVRAAAAGFAVLGVALGFSLEGSQPIVSLGTALPYLAAVAGAVLWTVPPKASRSRKSGQGAGTEA